MNPATALILAPIAAVLLEGVYRKTIARMQSRKGPPILQPYYDLRKLLAKKKLKTKNDWFFLNAPSLYFVTLLIGTAFIPFQAISFEYDIIFILYITILSSAFYVLAGISSDSPFGILASTRELRTMILYETALAAGILAFAVHSGTTSIIGLKDLAIINMIPSAAALIGVALVENKITQFDTGEAVSEILPGVSTEYSGKTLFWLDLSEMMKKLFFISLLSTLFAGSNLLAWATSFVIIFLAMAYSDTTTPRFTLHKTLWYLLSIFIIALIDLTRVMWAITWA